MTKKEIAFVRTGRLAHLATADKSSRPLVIPLCYAFDGRALYSSIDEKPKRLAPLRLKRMKNIRANPHVCFVVDRYDENWRRLAYVLIRGEARVLFRGKKHEKAVFLLRRKYLQYRRMAIEKRPIIEIVPTHTKSWGAL